MQRGTFRLFRFLGINVFLHWSWFLIAVYEVQVMRGRYLSPVWAVLEYLSLFAIVTMHEFGHALACRQTGGYADRIILWPLGGVAFVQPPPRAGAYLWSIAAGPLVNVLLFPFFTAALFIAGRMGLRFTHPDFYTYLHALWAIDTMLLIFNLLPIYPLDGGQLVRGLLWLAVGPIRSLKIASVIGFIGAVAFAGVAYWLGSIWLGVIALFIFSQAQIGWRAAQALDLESASAARADATVSPPATESRP